MEFNSEMTHAPITKVTHLSINRTCVGIVCCLALVNGFFCLSPSLHAQTDERVTVRIDGRSVLRLGATEELSPGERSERIEQRIGTLLERPEALSDPQVEVSPENEDERLIVVSGARVMTVTREDAEDNVTTVDEVARQWADALGRAIDRAAQRRTSTGRRFIIEVQSSVEAAFGRLSESAIKVVPRALAAMLVLAAFWAIATFVRWLMRLLFHRYFADVTVENLFKQLAYYAVWGLGLIVAVDAFGLDPQTVVTGLGLTGLALGFALKDVLSNFVSGILILTFRSFRLGDQIVVGDTEGSVERIELRATQIRTYDGRAVLVPNAELLTSRIINNTAAPVRRASVDVILGYEADLPKVRNAMMEAMHSVDDVLGEPLASVRIRELRPDGVRLEARFWTDSRRSDFLATVSRVSEAIVKYFSKRQIPFPQPGERLIAPIMLDRWRAIAENRHETGSETGRAARNKEE